MDAVQAPIIPVVAAIIRETPGTISLGQGIVHYGPPPAALEAARAAIGVQATHEYQADAGLQILIDRIAAKLGRDNGIDVARGRRIVVTAGSNMAFMHAVLTITQPGDEIILNVPFYFNHEMATEMAGCRAVRVQTDAAYQLRLDAIRAAITDRTRAIVTVSPNNPSGAVLTEASLRAVNALCAERGLYHISDEAYEYFTYGDARHVSAGSFPGSAPHTISMYSLSKAYGMAGWRVGYMAYPEHLEDAMLKSQDTIIVCAAIVAQMAACAALDVGRSYCEPYVRELSEVRRLVVDRLSALAPMVELPAADGGFYCLLRVHTAIDPMTLCERLIRRHRVAVLPGPSFGMDDGCYLRVAYGALQKETVAEGVGRLVAGLRQELEGGRIRQDA